jgi:hypothetical protein
MKKIGSGSLILNLDPTGQITLARYEVGFANLPGPFAQAQIIPSSSATSMIDISSPVTYTNSSKTTGQIVGTLTDQKSMEILNRNLKSGLSLKLLWKTTNTLGSASGKYYTTP